MTEETIFTAALGKDAPALAAFLDAACAGDSALRRRVEALLASHADADFLGTPAVGRPIGPFPSGLGDDTRTGPAAPDAGDDLDFLDPSDKPDSIGRLGHYEVQEVVGRCGMGVVLKAFDERLHRVVAVKVMAPPLAASATARRRFTREARAAAAVTHDHVVTIHAVEDAGPLPYIVMQFVAGASLQDRLDRTGPLHLPEILRIGMQTASGLAAAHAQGLVHRDVKPANILLENGVERVKITDFGLARAADDASLTQAGAVAGTPQYMSPEQAEGKPVDARSDLFSLGSVLYATCTGQPPFRGSTARSVLKRVVEDAPPPVREANPEIPGWLADVIEKLHAKDPADRYQSASEVADVLGRHLAHLQHPSQVAEPTVPRPKSAPTRRPRKHRWAVAAVVLALLTAGLGLTEAAGVTKFRATVIRVFTPDGTLVVEVDDPDVKVTIEGDGGLVITGAGPKEIRLPSGSYKVQAVKDGKPVKLDRDLVAISRGDRQIVRVRLEGEAPAAVALKTERGAFVVLTGKGVEVRKFDTLAEAVQSSSGGDTIEVRGNGPFVSDGVSILHPLVIRAGEGYTPSIALSQSAAAANILLLEAHESLVLEGLDLQRVGGPSGRVGDRYPAVLSAWHGGSLHLTNCRLILNPDARAIQGVAIGTKLAALTVRNCNLSGDGDACGWFCASGGRYSVENCVIAVGGLGISQFEPDVTNVSINVRGNTFIGECVNLTSWSKPNLPERGAAAPPIRLNFSGNVTRQELPLRGRGLLFFHQFQPKEPVSAAQAEALLPRLVGLDEKLNVYQTDTRMLMVATDWHSLGGTRGLNLADWDRLWAQQNTGSVEGNVRFQGGDLVTRAITAPERLTAADFRLRPDSAGYKAGKDGKDLGADVDLVGPGPAYERWKKTPAYQQWLKESGQVKK